MKKNLKKILSVVLCMAMMFTFMTVISFAADGDVTPVDPGTPGAETIMNLIKALLTNVNWASIIAILTTTVQTIMRLLGAGA